MRIFPRLAMVLVSSAALACLTACSAAHGTEAVPTPVKPPAAAPVVAVAQAAPAPTADLAAVAAHIPGAKVADLRTTPVAGLYEYRHGAELVYVTADGRFGFVGDLYRLADHSNLSDARRRELRLAMLSTVPESSMVIFAPDKPRYTVTVFTDVDCAYCRALHKQIAEYNRLGVRVRYLSFPRTGPNTESWAKAEQVWCSADRRSALTQAKLGQALKVPVCSPNPVASQYELGRSMGLTGTPGIITESGDLLPGYAPPEELLQELEQDAAGAAGQG